MFATGKQVRLMERLHELGALIPCDDDGDPDFSAYDDSKKADIYIKKWGHLMRSGVGTTELSAGEWGGVPNM